MLQRLGNDRSTLAGPIRVLLERSVRSPVFGLARWPMLRIPGGGVGADSIERHLTDCFGTEVRVGVVLGPRRANQKPVLQAFGLDGTLLGYAKVGHNALTSALVRREAESLTSLGGRHPRSFQMPRLLHHGHWAGLDVLVMSPLSSDSRSTIPPATQMAAMREVASLAGVRRAPLAETTFWSRLRDSTRRLADSPDGDRLQVVFDAMEESDGAVQVELGGWHGDWGRWNMGMGDGVLRLWDWERYDPDVPIGFDGLHFVAQSVRPGAREERQQEEHFLRSVPQTLSALGVEPGQHELTLRLYLFEMGVRYIDALTYGATPALRRRNSWVLTLLERLSEQSLSLVSEEGP